jgi:hypothetical protein
VHSPGGALLCQCENIAAPHSAAAATVGNDLTGAPPARWSIPTG